MWSQLNVRKWWNVNFQKVTEYFSTEVTSAGFTETDVRNWVPSVTEKRRAPVKQRVSSWDSTCATKSCVQTQSLSFWKVQSGLNGPVECEGLTYISSLVILQVWCTNCPLTGNYLQALSCDCRKCLFAQITMLCLQDMYGINIQMQMSWVGNQQHLSSAIEKILGW